MLKPRQPKRGRPKADRIRVNLKIDPKVYRQVRKAAKAEGLTNSAFVERAVVEQLERTKATEKPKSAGQK
jgi:hypothetical protein